MGFSDAVDHELRQRWEAGKDAAINEATHRGDEPVLAHSDGNTVYTRRMIEGMRRQLENETDLDLHDLSDKSVVANHLARARTQ